MPTSTTTSALSITAAGAVQRVDIEQAKQLAQLQAAEHWASRLRHLKRTRGVVSSVVSFRGHSTAQ